MENLLFEATLKHYEAKEAEAKAILSVGSMQQADGWSIAIGRRRPQHCCMRPTHSTKPSHWRLGWTRRSIRHNPGPWRKSPTGGPGSTSWPIAEKRANRPKKYWAWLPKTQTPRGWPNGSTCKPMSLPAWVRFSRLRSNKKGRFASLNYLIRQACVNCCC